MTKDHDKPFSVAVETIDAETAETYLLKTDHNPRKPRQAMVDRYARDMAAGNWHLGSGFLAFDLCGCLVQGQHTLRAVVESDSIIEVVVFRNLTPEAVRSLDTGRVRMFSEVLANEGVAASNSVAAVCRLLWRWERDLHTAGGNIIATTDELAEFLAHNEGIIDSTNATLRLRQKPLLFRSSIAGAVHYAATTMCPDRAPQFFDDVFTGANLAADSGQFLLRQWLINDATSGALGKRSDDAKQHAMAIKAWNAYILGRPIKQLKWSRGIPFPTMYGYGGATWPLVKR